MEGQIEEGDLVRLRGKWQETMAKIHGAFPAPRAAPEYAHMPHKACQPCVALCAENITCVRDCMFSLLGVNCICL